MKKYSYNYNKNNTCCTKIITNTLKKVLFNLVMTKIHNRSIIFAAVGLRLTWVQFYCHDFDQNRPPQMISPGFPTMS